MRVIISPEARKDMIAIRKYTRNKWGQLTLTQLKKSFKHTASLLSKSPYSGLTVHGTSYRKVLMKQQKLWVYYQIQEDVVVIAHIFHPARDPENQGLL